MSSCLQDTDGDQMGLTDKLHLVKQVGQGVQVCVCACVHVCLCTCMHVEVENYMSTFSAFLLRMSLVVWLTHWKGPESTTECLHHYHRHIMCLYILCPYMPPAA